MTLYYWKVEENKAHKHFENTETKLYVREHGIDMYVSEYLGFSESLKTSVFIPTEVLNQLGFYRAT